MANKWLLSLLFLISITNLFWTNAEVTSCFTDRQHPQDNRRTVRVLKKCSGKAKHACFKEVLQSSDGIMERFGCATENTCNENGVTCCWDDNCNKNL